MGRETRAIKVEPLSKIHLAEKAYVLILRFGASKFQKDQSLGRRDQVAVKSFAVFVIQMMVPQSAAGDFFSFFGTGGPLPY